MKYINILVLAPESTILAADIYVAISFIVKETNAVPAGYLMAKTGLKAAATIGISAADAATDAIGILLHTVDSAVNFNGALLIQGVIDVDKAKLSGFTYSANDIAALKKAVFAVFCCIDVGAKSE
jgi:hypothetical protein